ncbi:MAG: EcsC family protein [Rhodothermales bacterium]|nr:EcsC family protein [Rhodothermales bacterium]
MRLTEYDRNARREIEAWQHGDAGIVSKMLNWAMQPMDWVVKRVITEDIEDQVDEAVSGMLSMLNDASEWTYDVSEILEMAKARGIEAERIEDLRDVPLELLDPLAREHTNENALLAAVEGGGTGLGGAVLIAADIPLLITINLRLIQQIGASFGFAMTGPDYRPLVLSIFNVASSSSKEAKNEAMREASVAGAALARDQEYRGRVSGSFREQNRHLPREIAKNILGRKLAQAIPIAGAAVGAGINYWFTTETAETAYMLMRALYLERKDRA